MAPPEDPKDYNNRSAGYLRLCLTERGIPWKTSWLKSQYVQAMVQHDKDTYQAQNQHECTDEEDPDGRERMAAVDRLLAAYKPWNKMLRHSFTIYHTQMLQRVTKAEERENKRNQEKADNYKKDLAKHVEEPEKYPLPTFPKLEFIPQSTNGMYQDAEDTRGDWVAKRAMLHDKAGAFAAEDERFVYGSVYGSDSCVDEEESLLEKKSQNKQGKEYDSGVTNDAEEELEYEFEDELEDDHQLGSDDEDDDGKEVQAPQNMNKRRAQSVTDLPPPKRVELAGAIKNQSAGISSSEPIDLTDDCPVEETTKHLLPPRLTTSATSPAVTQTTPAATSAPADHSAVSATGTHIVGAQNENENEQDNEASTGNLLEDEYKEPEIPDRKPEFITPFSSVHPHYTRNFVFIASRYLKPRGDRRAVIERMTSGFKPVMVTVHSDGYYIRWKNFDRHRRTRAIECAEYIQAISSKGDFKWEHCDAVWPEVVIDGETHYAWQGEASEDAFLASHFAGGC